MIRPSSILRFAPSPNGRLHLGHAFSALLNDRFARRLGGVCRLRIEDIDPVRSKPDFTEAIIADLAWLGLTYPEPFRHQSRHRDEYASARDRLVVAGLAYPCFCSRGEIRTQVAATGATTGDPDGAPLYPGTCRHRAPDDVDSRLKAGQPHTWRLDMARALAAAAPEGPFGALAFDDDGERWVACDPAAWGDAVIVRRDVPTSYHLSVVHDDALEGTTHVVRGADLEAATGLHVLLQRLLGLPTPRYHHHRLIYDEGGLKLAKSRASTSLAQFRAQGVSPAQIRIRLGFAESGVQPA